MTNKNESSGLTHQGWDEETDLLVFGSGAGGLSATLFGARAGLNVLLYEKSPHLGGTTAISGGGIWVPGTAWGLAMGDTLERVREYLRNELGKYYRADLIEAYLANGAKVIELLDAETEVKFDPLQWPDYHSDAIGGAKIGRSLMARPFDGRKLGADLALLQKPMHRLMILGGLMVGNDEVNDFLRPFSSFSTFTRVATKVARYALDRLRYSRGTDLRFGNALVASMLFSLPRQNVTIHTDSPLVELIRENGRVCGAVVRRSNANVRVRALRGVVLATGGFPHNRAMLQALGPDFPHQYSVGHEANVGDGINAAREVGAAVDTRLSSLANWTPASVVKEKDGRTVPVMYGYLSRGRPGMIAVNPQGQRFVNESNSYNDIVTALFRDSAGRGGSYYFICDRAFVHRHGLGPIYPWPWTLSLATFIRSGQIKLGETLAELAERIGVPANELSKTVEKHNSYCKTGVDPEFGKGSTAYNRMFGYKTVWPNPNLAPIQLPPFIALQIHAASMGTTIGLKTNSSAQILDEHDQPVPGLYACGNDLAAVMRGFYPGGGTMIGPAIVFGYLAVEHILAACDEQLPQ